MSTETSDEALRLDHQLCFPLYAAARRIVSLYTPYLKPLGLTYTQYLVLMVLWEEDHKTVGDLCRRLYLDSGTLTPLLKKMESAGLVRRTRSEEDERVVTVTLTQAGADIKNQVRTLPQTVGGCLDLTPGEAMHLYSLLYRLLQGPSLYDKAE